MHRAGLLLFLTFLALNRVIAAADAPPIDITTASFPSPDGRYTARFEQNADDGWCYLIIKDSAGMEIGKPSVVYLTPLYSIYWTRDSRNLVTVGHVAHGSAATFFHFRDGAWLSKIIYPPDREPDPKARVFYHVAKVEIEDTKVKVIYNLTMETQSQSHDIQDKFYTATIHVDPTTCQILDSNQIGTR